MQEARPASNWSLTAMAAARRLLQFSGQLRADSVQMPANDLATEAVELCRYRCEMEGLLLMSDLDPNAGQIEVKPGQVLQILIAMLQNAREALAVGGEGGSIDLTTSTEDGQVTFAVEDDGPGIPTELGERVFDLGFTTKEDGQPAGLGLTIGRHVARAHGGDLTIAVAHDGGLQTLMLPQSPS